MGLWDKLVIAKEELSKNFDFIKENISPASKIIDDGVKGVRGGDKVVH